MLISVCSAGAQEPFECKGQYYLSLTKSASNSSELYEVKIDTDGIIRLDTVSSSIGLVLNAMGYRITDNLIYGTDPNTGRLRKVGKDGVAIDLGFPKDLPRDRLYYAGDITPDGKYLILIGLRGGSPQIVKVDLESPDYQCTFVELKDPFPGLLDVAFDPFTGILYGHDTYKSQMVIIDPDTGELDTDFIVQREVDQIGALFFDSFGNLYGYGAYGTTAQNKFLAIDKVTGRVTLLAQGPNSTGQDGCSCPYTLELQKIVTPDTVYQCSEVVYSFIVSNSSGTTRSNISIEDKLPSGMKINMLIKNPFGGEVSIDENHIVIENMVIPVGIDTIHLSVNIGDKAPGVYQNQAVLSGLPIALGSFTLSDNPATIIEKDSTPLVILPLDLEFLGDDYFVCKGDSLEINLQQYFGVIFNWDDGDTDNVKFLQSPGFYTVSLSSGCENLSYNVRVSDEVVSTLIREDTVFINLGEEALFHGDLYGDDIDNVELVWTNDGQNPAVDCSDCLVTLVQPLFDGYYYLSVVNENGCGDMDSVFVRVKKERDIFYPNIISLDGYEGNRKFYLFGNEKSAKGLDLRIYDRWGNLVFKSGEFQLGNSSNGWDGTFKGKDVVAGVYTWVAEIKYIDDYFETFCGDVTVIW